QHKHLPCPLVSYRAGARQHQILDSESSAELLKAKRPSMLCGNLSQNRNKLVGADSKFGTHALRIQLGDSWQERCGRHFIAIALEGSGHVLFGCYQFFRRKKLNFCRSPDNKDCLAQASNADRISVGMDRCMVDARIARRDQNCGTCGDVCVKWEGEI